MRRFSDGVPPLVFDYLGRTKRSDWRQSGHGEGREIVINMRWEAGCPRLAAEVQITADHLAVLERRIEPRLRQRLENPRLAEQHDGYR